MFRSLCYTVRNQRTLVLMKQITTACYQSNSISSSSINILATPNIWVPKRIPCLPFSTITNDTSLSTAVDVEVSNFKEWDALTKMFQCTDAEAAEVLELLTILCADGIDLRAIKKTVKWLHRCGATLPIIRKNCHLLILPIDKLKKTFERLNRSQWKQTDDFLPLLGVEETKIRNIQLYQGHVIRDRIYLLSELFSIEPHTISHYCAKHLFIFEMEMNILKPKIDMLINCGVLPESLLHDLHVLARAKDVIKERLKFIKENGIERVMPWMIKCSLGTLTRSINIRSQREIEQNKMLEILATRLNWHGQTAHKMFKKYKFLQMLDSDTASQLLDELLRVFSPEEITTNIDLLNLPVACIKIRIDELISLNSTSISPKLMNISDTRFEQYLKEKKNK